VQGEVYKGNEGSKQHFRDQIREKKVYKKEKDHIKLRDIIGKRPDSRPGEGLLRDLQISTKVGKGSRGGKVQV